MRAHYEGHYFSRRQWNKIVSTYLSYIETIDLEILWLDDIALTNQHEFLSSAVIFVLYNNFFQLLQYSSAEYVMFADQDDVWLPQKIQLTLDKMQQMVQQYGAISFIRRNFCIVYNIVFTFFAPLALSPCCRYNIVARSHRNNYYQSMTNQ